MKANTITGPIYWASYFINGDASGLDADEKANADAWLAREGIPQPCSIVEDSERFTWSFGLYAPECGVSGGDVCDYIYLTE